VTALKPVTASDGTFHTMDVVIHFRALGRPQFVVLWECKRTTRPVECSDVQILRDKLTEVGTHKCILASVSGYQNGAIEYANKHGITTIQLFDQVAKFNSFAEMGPMPQRVMMTRVIGRYATWIFHSSAGQAMTVDIAEQHPDLLQQEIGLPAGPTRHTHGCQDCSEGTHILKPGDKTTTTRATGVQRVSPPPSGQ
jgi:hypothetical protein